MAKIQALSVRSSAVNVHVRPCEKKSFAYTELQRACYKKRGRENKQLSDDLPFCTCRLKTHLEPRADFTFFALGTVYGSIGCPKMRYLLDFVSRVPQRIQKRLASRKSPLYTSRKTAVADISAWGHTLPPHPPRQGRE